MRKLVLLLSFFAGAPFLFLFSLIFFLLISYQADTGQTLLTNRQNTVAYAALPAEQFVLTDSIGQSEAREETLRQFFTRYNSPLLPFTHGNLS